MCFGAFPRHVQSFGCTMKVSYDWLIDSILSCLQELSEILCGKLLPLYETFFMACWVAWDSKN